MNWRSVVATCVIVLCASSAYAQFDSAQISGVVQDSSGAVLPGVVGGSMGGSVPTGVGTFATGVTSINGGRADEFMTTIDGAPSIRVRAAGGFMMGAQNFDTVAEVQVLTTNYQAEYGRSSAGQLRLVTKSGTQSFRGNVFWSHQNDALDATTVVPRSTCTNCSPGSATTIVRPSRTPPSAICSARTVRPITEVSTSVVAAST